MPRGAAGPVLDAIAEIFGTQAAECHINIKRAGTLQYAWQ
jgi:hypothetical protein